MGFVSLKPLWSRAEQVNELTDDTKRLSIHRPSGFAGRVLLGSRPGLAVEDRAVALYNSRGLQRLHPDWSSWRKEHSPVNIPDPILKRFGYGQLWPLCPACRQSGRIVYAESDFPHPFQLRFFILCKTDSDPIWMAWSGFGQKSLVLKQACVQESFGPVSGRTQPARYQFPTFRFDSVLPQTSRIILCKTSQDPIKFCLIVSGFGQTDPVRKLAGVQQSSGPLLANASQPIRTGCESDPACLLGA